MINTKNNSNNALNAQRVTESLSKVFYSILDIFYFLSLEFLYKAVPS